MKALSILATILAPVATGLVVGAIVWALFLFFKFGRRPGPGHYAAIIVGALVALICFLLTMPGGPLDHFGASGRKLRPPEDR